MFAWVDLFCLRAGLSQNNCEMSLTTRPPSSPSGFAIATFFGTELSTRKLNVAALTTIFTPGLECQGRWLLPPGYSWVYSTSPYDTKSYDIDPAYLSCQPLGYMTYYSPGVCPDGQSIATAVKVSRVYAGSSSSLYWNANCCPR